MKHFLKQSQHIGLILAIIGILIFSSGALAAPQTTTGETLTSAEKLENTFSGPTVVSVTAADANPTSADSVTFIVTFSASVIDVDISNFTISTSGVSGASVSGFSGSGSTYSVTVNTGSGDGTIQLNVLDNDNIEDINGNYFDDSFSGGDVYIIERTGPTVTSVTLADANPTNAGSVNFIVTFSKPVIDVDLSNFSLTAVGVSGASVTSFSGSGDSYTVTANTGSGDGTIQLNVLDNDNVEDLVGNYFDTPHSGGEAYIIEKPAPTIGSIKLSDANPTSADSVDFIVKFSKPVIDVTVDTFHLATTGVDGASISSMSGSGDTYTVTVDTGSGDGTIRLDVMDIDSIEDLEGNFFDSPYDSGEEYIVEKPEPAASPLSFIGDFFEGIFGAVKNLFK